MSLRVVVVGAGLVGACAAWRLAKAGAEVTVVERELPCSGATGTSFAWVGASHDDAVSQPEYFRLKLEAARARERLAADLGDGIGLHRTGLIIWSDRPGPAASLEAGLRRVAEEGVAAELISRARAAELEPELAIPGEPLAIGYCPDDGYVVGQTMVAAVLRAARAKGAVVRSNTPVVAISQRHGRATGVVTVGGEELAADRVVVAAGAATGELVQSAGGLLPLVPPRPRGSDAVGLIVTTDPTSSLLRRLVVNDQVMFRPDGGGRLLLHSYDIDREVMVGDPPDQLLEWGQQVAEITRRFLPPEVRLRVSSARVGVRPLPTDGLTVAGPVPELPGLYAAVTHSGVTLGPLLGELIAEELVQERPAPALARFRPDRFASGGEPG